MHLLGRYNIYLTKLNRMEIVIEHRIQETGDRRQKLVPEKAGNRRRRTDDRWQNRQVRESGQEGADEQDNRESACKISADHGSRIRPDLLDNCRESSTNRPPFLQNKANFPAVQNQRKLSYSKGL